MRRRGKNPSQRQWKPSLFWFKVKGALWLSCLIFLKAIYIARTKAKRWRGKKHIVRCTYTLPTMVELCKASSILALVAKLNRNGFEMLFSFLTRLLVAAECWLLQNGIGLLVLCCKIYWLVAHAHALTLQFVCTNFASFWPLLPIYHPSYYLFDGDCCQVLSLFAFPSRPFACNIRAFGLRMRCANWNDAQIKMSWLLFVCAFRFVRSVGRFGRLQWSIVVIVRFIFVSIPA